jgi:hypothetical protein
MVTSGMVFFAPVAGGAALTYSLTYNASTVVPETLLALWLLPPLVRALARANPADSWRRGLLTPPRLTPRIPRPISNPPATDTTIVTTDTEPVIPRGGRAAVTAPTASGTKTKRAALHAPLVREGSFVRPGPFGRTRTAALRPISVEVGASLLGDKPWAVRPRPAPPS